MSSLKEETISLINCLPDEELVLFNELAKKLVFAWDPDFTKLTKAEAERIKKIEETSDKRCTGDDIDTD